MSGPEQTRWFNAEVQPHESALRAYLRTQFPMLSDHDDLVQEAFSRVLQTRATAPVGCARALLFVTARNAALDSLRRRSVRPHAAIIDFGELTVVDDRPGVAEVVGRQQELDLLAEAVDALPERCREVVLLRYLDGLSYKEIAARLDLSPETVKVHLAKGMKRCSDFFADRGLLADSAPREVASS